MPHCVYSWPYITKYGGIITESHFSVSVRFESALITLFQKVSSIFGECVTLSLKLFYTLNEPWEHTDRQIWTRGRFAIAMSSVDVGYCQWNGVA